MTTITTQDVHDHLTGVRLSQAVADSLKYMEIDNDDPSLLIQANLTQIALANPTNMTPLNNALVAARFRFHSSRKT